MRSLSIAFAHEDCWNIFIRRASKQIIIWSGQSFMPRHEILIAAVSLHSTAAALRRSDTNSHVVMQVIRLRAVR